MNCWPYSSDSFCAISRPRISVVPPAANGTTTLTTRVGHCVCADAPPTNGSESAGGPWASTVRRLGFDKGGHVDVRSERIVLLLQFLRVFATRLAAGAAQTGRVCSKQRCPLLEKLVECSSEGVAGGIVNFE